jgi:hypothetical protein
MKKIMSEIFVCVVLLCCIGGLADQAVCGNEGSFESYGNIRYYYSTGYWYYNDLGYLYLSPYDLWNCGLYKQSGTWYEYKDAYGYTYLIKSGVYVDTIVAVPDLD